MQLRNLISFIHVAELGSFTKAAQQLGYSQSTISFQIRQLEEELEGAKDYAPLIEAGMAIKYIRENAEKYNTDPNYVFISGFSAGGHLAASAGTLWNVKPVREALGIESGEAPEGINRPTGTILSYPVITGGDKAHKGSIKNVS